MLKLGHYPVRVRVLCPDLTHHCHLDKPIILDVDVHHLECCMHGRLSYLQVVSYLCKAAMHHRCHRCGIRPLSKNLVNLNTQAHCLDIVETEAGASPSFGTDVTHKQTQLSKITLCACALRVNKSCTIRVCITLTYIQGPGGSE